MTKSKTPVLKEIVRDYLQFVQDANMLMGQHAYFLEFDGIGEDVLRELNHRLKYVKGHTESYKRIADFMLDNLNTVAKRADKETNSEQLNELN